MTENLYVCVRTTDPRLLAEKLEREFEAGSYEVYMKHNVYSIKAPRRLSDAEIAECTLVRGDSHQREEADQRLSWWQELVRGRFRRNPVRQVIGST